MNSLYRIICRFPDRSLPLSRREVPLFLRTFHFLRMLNLLEPCERRIYDCYLCVLSSRRDFVRIYWNALQAWTLILSCASSKSLDFIIIITAKARVNLVMVILSAPLY